MSEYVSNVLLIYSVPAHVTGLQIRVDLARILLDRVFSKDIVILASIVKVTKRHDDVNEVARSSVCFNTHQNDLSGCGRYRIKDDISRTNCRDKFMLHSRSVANNDPMS